MTRTITPGAPLGGAERIGGPDRVLGEDEVRAFVREQLARLDVDGASVCVLVPDAHACYPLGLVLPAIHGALHGRVRRLTVLVALGTHARMSDAALAQHLGYGLGALEATYPATTVLNHEWWDLETFATVGRIDPERIAALSHGHAAARRSKCGSIGRCSSSTT